MTPSRSDKLPAVRIEGEDESAWCGAERLPLMPRAFAVLQHLVAHAGRLVTKEALLASVWRDAAVSDAALTTCIRDLRRALGDSPDAPRYIETVHRRGFRFIGPLAGPASRPRAASGVPAEAARPAVPARIPSEASPPSLVGRDTELARLHELLGQVMSRQRQLVFVTGEPGIGKTALVDAFLARIDRTDFLRVGRGQCVEQYGAGEAYLPVLEALGRLGREPRGDEVVRVLKQHAPTWLVQLPALLGDQDLEAVHRRAHGATRERMLRELVEGLDALTIESPLVLVLEDLHWSDSATIDLLAMLARRREPARLLVLGTYRPADIAASTHPLKAVKPELELHAQCKEIALDFLTEAAVAEYLSRRFAQDEWPAELPQALHRQTDGNPLFLVNTIDDLIAQGQLSEVGGRWGLGVPVKGLGVGAPETLWQMVEKQIERLAPDEQATLAVAAVAGAEFSAASAAVRGMGVEEAERRCEALARRGQFVRSTGLCEWPDGTVAGRYAFIHALYQHVLYARIPVGVRAELHLSTGVRLEQGHAQRTQEIAGELAMHFIRGRDFSRAARYHHQAARQALSQHGYREAAGHLTRALDSLKALPDSQARRQQELALHVMLGSALLALMGHAAPEVERSYARARELCEQVDDDPRLLPALRGLGRFYLVRGSLDAAHGVGQRVQAMAESTGDAATLLAARDMLGHVSFYRGELAAALAHLERAIELRDPTLPTPRGSSTFRLILDPGVSCAAHAAWSSWMLGYPARAAARMREALALGRSIAHPFSLAHAGRFAAALHHVRRERTAAREQAEASVAVSGEHAADGNASPYYGYGAVLMAANFHRGWALVDQGRREEGLASMQAWVKTCRDTGSTCLLPSYLAWLAETYGEIGKRREGLELVSEGLDAARAFGTHYWTAELYRLRGELTDAEADAQSSFLEALAIARRQRAKSFELRAATSLSRLWVRQGNRREAHALLAGVYAWFTEGFDTPDLKQAQALLEELEAAPSA